MKISGKLNSIKLKIFVFYFATALVAEAAFGWIAYRYVSGMLVQEEYDRMASVSAHSSERLNQMFDNLQFSLSQVNDQLSEQAMTQERIGEVLGSTKVILDSNILQLIYIDHDREWYASDAASVDADIAGRIYDETMASEGGLASFIGPYYVPRGGMTLAYAEKVRRGSALQGVLFAQLDLSHFNEAFAAMNSDSRLSLLLLNKEDRPVISDIKMNYADYVGLLPLLQGLDSLEGKGEVVKPASPGSGEYLVQRQPVGFNDWKLLYFVDKKLLLLKIYQFREYALFFAFIFTAVIAALSFYVARYIDQPIRSFTRQIKRIMDNSLHLRVRLNRNDEFVVLVHAFNVMLDRINLLIEERTRDEAAKKEYKFKALQSQINPHFLYNTLHSINSLIDLNRVKQIPTVIHSLVQLFQYTMDKQSEFVRIRTELTGLQHYVAIQKIRYRNKFEVRYSVGERMLDLPTLKFILQPIVENAIFHGIEESAGGLITIGGEVDEDSRTVLLFVEDNGVGMPEERLESLLAPRASGPAPTASARLRGLNSIGLPNVHERLQLYFGADYGLRIYSREQAGTRVEIRFPIIHNEDDRPFGTEGQP